MKSEETNSSILIQLDHISRSYGCGEAESFALKDFSLEVKRGEFIMIMGPSGCGKTTLLNVIGLLDRPTSGSYCLNGQATERLSSRKKAHIRSRQIGYIFQNFNLISTLPVIENVALPLVYSGKSKSRRLLAASDILKTFHLQEREYYYPHQLSGGQQQRVCIARSLVNHPEIILADEPTGNLDSRSSHIVMEELRNIHAEGNTIIMVTHNPQLTTYATRVIHMLDGQIDVDIKTVSDDDLPQFTSEEEPPVIPTTSTISTSETVSTSKNSDAAPASNLPKNTPQTPIAPKKSTPAPKSENAPDDIKSSEKPKKPAKPPVTEKKYSSGDIKSAEIAAKSDVKIHAPGDKLKTTPLGEISDIPMKSRLTGKNAFPVVGSLYTDKSVRTLSKPTIEDLVILPKSPKPRTKSSKKGHK